jgi:hypothetical protein
MVHVTQSHLPEIVLFGKDQHFHLPLVLDAGKNTLVKGLDNGNIRVSRFSAGAEPQQREVSTRVDEVIRAIVDLGGTYPDVVQALQQAKVDGSLVSRMEVDALPEPGRRYDRAVKLASAGDDESASSPGNNEPALELATPLSDLFKRPR